MNSSYGGALRRRPRARRDVGFTFVELLVTIVLMGTVVVGILAATRALVIASRTGREEASVQSALLAAAEQLERAPRDTYQCTNLDVPIYAAAAMKLGLTPAQVPNYVQLGFQHLEGDVWVDGACPVPSGFQPNLVQRVRITITSPDNGLKRTLEVVKGDV